MSSFAPISDLNVFSNDVLAALANMSITGNLKGVIVYGSAAIRAGGGAVSASDIDSHQDISFKDTTDDDAYALVARGIRNAVKRLVKSSLSYVPEIKAGVLADCNVLGKATITRGVVVGFDLDHVMARLDRMLADGLLAKSEYDEALATVSAYEKDKSLVNFLVMKDLLRYDVVRWSAREVVAGVKAVRGNRKLTFEQAIRMPAMVKVEYVRWVGSSNAFVEFSMVYAANGSDGKALLGVESDVKELKMDVVENVLKSNVVKAMKRIRALTRLMGEKKDFFAISEILSGSVGQLTRITSLVRVLLDVMRHKSRVALAGLELDAIKNALSQVADISTKDLAELDSWLDAAIHTTSKTRQIRYVDLLESRIARITELMASRALKRIGLWPLPSRYIP